jgi:osmotically inducible protein OsmC
MKKRNGTAIWNGPGKTGKGQLSTQSGVLAHTQYSYSSRFEEGIGTNPEELIAAAHAGCFSMKLSFVLGAAGFEPESIETECTITLDNGTITNSHLKVVAAVKGIPAEKFDACVQEAKTGCPVSKLLKAEITHESVLRA